MLVRVWAIDNIAADLFRKTVNVLCVLLRERLGLGVGRITIINGVVDNVDVALFRAAPRLTGRFIFRERTLRYSNSVDSFQNFTSTIDTARTFAIGEHFAF